MGPGCIMGICLGKYGRIYVNLSFFSISFFSVFQENHTSLIPSSEARSTEGNSCSASIHVIF